MNKHSEKTEPSNSTKPVLAVVINKTIGGFEIKDFKVLEKPIDRHILEPHIYEGTILKSHKDTEGNYVDTYCTWDRFGKCPNWERSDCFIDVSSCNSGRIDVENSKSYWAVNANYPNNWTLQKDYYSIGKNRLHDKSGFHIYGSVNEIMYGENKGKIEADIPCYDEETESDRLVLGVFDTVEEAMKVVLERNFPEFSSNYF